jgi:dihydroxy-acid dehydratase
VNDGDEITIDIEARVLTVDLTDDEIARRQAAATPPPQRSDTGVFARYRASVGSASEGAVLAPPSGTANA